jgi:hypothetical protein
MTVSIESLEMDEDTRELCRQIIRKMAYAKWLEAGSPQGDGNPFWMEAEREWIERHYVPPRLPSVEAERNVEEPQVFAMRIPADELQLQSDQATCNRSHHAPS